MENIFKLSRFLRLLKKSLFERPVQLFGLTLMILGLVLLIYSTCRDLVGYPTVHFMTFFLGLVGGGYFLAAAVFGQFSTYARGASYLTLPVSNLEKWLCGVVIILLIYVPLFLLFYRLMDSTLVEIYRNNLDPKIYNYKWKLEEAKVLDYDSLNVKILSYIFYNISGIMLLGALFFNKLANIKVAIIICGILFLGLGINYVIANSLFPTGVKAFPFLYATIKTDDNYRNVELPTQAQLMVSITFMYVLPVVLYLLAFIKLREKEF